MVGVTQLLDVTVGGDTAAAAELLPLVDAEPRKLTARHLATEKPGQTLQPTALVHEAHVRLVGGEQPQSWAGRGHLFAAAKILCERCGAWRTSSPTTQPTSL